jgi:palmitoyltransferase
MDHHCPWINSCIGFYNRKFFIQMVFYLIITIFSTIIANSFSTYYLIKDIIVNKKFEFNLKFTIQLVYALIYGIDIVMGFILSQFFKFHIKLILENKTTIETLDHKGKEFQSKFDKGRWNNWIEVMGITKWLWFIPLKIYQGKPKGNGIDWGESEEDMIPSSYRGEGNNINDETGNENYKNIELSEKLNEQKDMDRSAISSIRNDVTGISALSKNQHGSMSSLYQ